MRALRRPRAVLASAVLAAALSLAACASAPAAGSTDFRVSRSRASDVSLRHIQGEALTRDPGRSLMDVMASYWPSSMRGDPFARQFGGEQGIGAYVNGNYMGGWDFLRTVRAGEVVRVQRLTQSEEYLQFGRSHPNGGVVLIFRNSIAR